MTSAWKRTIVAAGLFGCMSLTGVVAAQTLPEGSVAAQPAVPEIAALVPKRIKDRGTLLVAAMTKYPPFSFTVDGKQVGMIPEMVTAVAQTMGLKAEISPVEFPAILLGLQAHRYDIGMGEFFVRADRVQVADFVSEWSNFDAYVVNKGSAYMPQNIGDACGHRIAILAGSSGVPAMEAAKHVCEKDGKPDPVVSSFPGMQDAVLALSSNRVDAVLTGREVGMTLQTSGQPFEPSGRVSGGPCATAIARTDDSEGLEKALQAAYVHLIKDGTYAEIHKRWHTDYGMIDTPTIYRPGDALPKYTD